ncbi:SGNH hydrolase domain-containing protein [Streptomyces rochei]|nr:SGNH hydrolase domain-containing protein [Streptomyces rochei]WMI61055.1 SGNH hydrolase domain-containing protein [Streptomyces rochei]
MGDVSYGWYLWHWPLLVLVPAALNRTATLPLSLQVSAVALLPAWASLRLVENPVRFRTSLRDRPGAALGLGLGLTSGVVCFCLVAASFPPTISSGVRSPALAESLAAARDPGDRLARLVSTAGNRLPANLSPALPDVKKQRSAVYRDGCHVGYGATRSPDCVYGDSASREVVVLFGDSHAAQWFPALDRVSRDNGWKLVSLTKASCKTADITTRSGGSAYTSCDTWREEALRRITELRPVLVVAASSEAAEPVHRMSDPSREWTRGYERVYRRLARDAGAVAVLLDSPWPKGDAVECAARHPLRLGECEADQRDAIRSPTLRKAGETAARRAGAEVVDPRPWLCPPRGGCPTVVADTFVYRDESHVAESYARALAPVVREEFRKLGLA